MLLQENIVQHIKEHLKQQKIYGTSKLTFTEDSTLVLTPEKKWHKVIHKLKLALSYINGVILWLQLAYELATEDVPIITSLKGLLFANAMTILYLVKGTVHRRAAGVAELFNLFMQFEQRHLIGNTFCCTFLGHCEIKSIY